MYKIKYNADGTSQKFKSRLIAKGFIQKQGINFDDTFSLVARLETTRIILGLAAQNRWSVFQFDVKSAFLNGYLKEDGFVKQPQGFVVKGIKEKV